MCCFQVIHRCSPHGEGIAAHGEAPVTTLLVPGPREHGALALAGEVRRIELESSAALERAAPVRRDLRINLPAKAPQHESPVRRGMCASTIFSYAASQFHTFTGGANTISRERLQCSSKDLPSWTVGRPKPRVCDAANPWRQHFSLTRISAHARRL
jgi:hypothetical protein